jgi:hypothetical protein
MVVSGVVMKTNSDRPKTAGAKITSLRPKYVYGKAKVKLSLCLTKYHAVQIYPMLN